MSWLDLSGWPGSALLIYLLMRARVLRFRVLNLVACIVLVVCNAVLGIYNRVGFRREGSTYLLHVDSTSS